MALIKSTVNRESNGFVANYKHNKNLSSQLERMLYDVRNKREPNLLKKHNDRGKLTVHERIGILTDEATHFLEFSPLAATDQYDNNFPGAGLVTGMGMIHGKETIIIANDATVKGGTYVHETIKKHLRAQEIALENHIPVVYLVDSGGVFLPEQSRVYPDKDHFGRIFYNQAQLSASRIPQVAVVMGSCTAGGAYIPAMSDESIIVKGTGSIFLAGPPLVKAATGEVVTVDELGGAHVHTEISGVADHIAENDKDALEICRSIFSHLNVNRRMETNRIEVQDPLYPADDLYGLIPVNMKRPFHMMEILARLVDGSRFQEFKAGYGKTIITGFAHIMGYNAGIMANNGILFSESALKATHFVELCCNRNIPLILFQNIAGFMVGKEYEHKGIAKDGAKMIQAIATANVPKLTVIIGGSFGAGNYAMAGRAFQPSLLFTWPNARISVMGGEQASEVLTSLKSNNGAGTPKQTGTEKDFQTYILQRFEQESTALYSTSRIWDDGILDPVQTREALGLGLAMSLNRPLREPKTGVFRM